MALSDEQKAKLKKIVGRLLMIVIPLVLGGTAGNQLTPTKTNTVEVEKHVPVPVPVADLDEFQFRGLIDKHGWQPDAEASAKDAAVVAFRTFADTPAGQVQDVPRQVFLWQAEQKLTGKPTPLKDQNPEGSCVGFGTTTAIERTLAAEIVSRKSDRSEFAHFSEEVTYIGSRNQGAVALGARPMNPRSQGSAGVYAKAFVTTYGMVPEGKYGSVDVTENSAARAAAWRSTGIPKELEAVAKKYPVKSAAKVATWKEAKTALASGYGISGCATWSYARQRDANGVAQPTREGWNHCMCIDGYIVTEDGREFGHVENSWSKISGVGPYHTGPTGWGNPTSGGFWAPADSLDRALRQGESYAYSGATGFPAKVLPVDWLIRAEPRRPVDRLTLAAELFALAP